MVFAALLLLLPVPQNGGASPATKTEIVIEAAATPSVSPSDAASSESTKAKAAATDASDKASRDSGKDSTLSASVTGTGTGSPALPSMPVAKASTPDAGAGGPASAAFPVAPVKPAITVIHETPTQRRLWYALAIAGHSGAAFDAWSTRRAISAGLGTEANPLLRPFAHSNALYAATQVSPLVMDFLGKRMITSQHTWIRKLWWLPQTAGASVSFTAGAHNVGLVH